MKKVELEKKVSELEKRLEAIEYTFRSPYYNPNVPKFIGGK